MHRRHLELLSVGSCLLLPFLLGGCGPGEERFIGSWRGEVRVRAGKDNGKLDAELKLGGLLLEVRQNHTFDLTMLLLPIEGRWRAEGTDLVLVPEKILGVTPSVYREMGSTVHEGPAGMAPTFDRERTLRWHGKDGSLSLVGVTAEPIQVIFKRNGKT